MSLTLLPNISCFFRRYIDDLLMIFAQEGNEGEFIKWLNMRDNNIQFAAHFDHDVIPFLDICIYRNEDNKLAVRPYKKSTDKNTYLHFKSFHPLHLRSNLPFGQFLRFKRNSTRDPESVLPIGILGLSKTYLEHCSKSGQRFLDPPSFCPNKNQGKTEFYGL